MFEKMAAEAKAAENRAHEQNKKALTALIRKAEAAYNKTHRDPMRDAELKADYIVDYLIKKDSFTAVDYKYHEFTDKIPVAV